MKMPMLDDNQQQQQVNARNIYRCGTDIYFYDFIDDETQSLFIRLYEEAVKEIYAKSGEHALKNHGDPCDLVTVHINSGGGDVFSSLAIYDYLKYGAEIPPVGVVEGRAASGASIVLLGCSRRLITKHSMMLIHELSSGTFGKLHQMKEDFENWENMMDLIKDVYRENTKIPEKELDKILEPDFYWKADKCKEYGLVDSVIGEDEEYTEEEVTESIKNLEEILKLQRKALDDIKKKGKKADSKKPIKKATSASARKKGKNVSSK